MKSMRLLAPALALLLGACAAPTPPAPPVKEMVYAVTAGNRLIHFNAGQPQKLLSNRPISGLAFQEQLLGIDFRVARGLLYGLGSSGQLYRIDPASASAQAIGAPAVLPEGRIWDIDFNPTVDRIRVVNDAGHSLRLHPDTGAVVDFDPARPGVQHDGRLAFDSSDREAGQAVAVVGTAYTYNKNDDKLTTNYVIDRRQGLLLMQGSREGQQPVVSPNTGRLYTVGPLGLSLPIERAALDIADLNNSAWAAVSPPPDNAGRASSRWVRIDLATGKAQVIGPIGDGELVTGIAIEP